MVRIPVMVRLYTSLYKIGCPAAALESVVSTTVFMVVYNFYDHNIEVWIDQNIILKKF